MQNMFTKLNKNSTLPLEPQVNMKKAYSENLRDKKNCMLKLMEVFQEDVSYLRVACISETLKDPNSW